LGALKPFFKDTFVYGVAAVLPRVINFLLVKVHSDALPAQTYAENTNFYVWAALAAVLVTIGFETAFFRFYQTEKKKDNLMTTAFWSIVATTALFVLITLAFFDFFLAQLDFGGDPIQMKLFIGILALDSLAVIPFAYLRVANKAKRYTAIKLINVGVIVLVNLLFLKYIPALLEEGNPLPTLLGHLFQSTELVNFIFVANVLGSAVSLCLLLPFLGNLKGDFDWSLCKKMLAYSWPIAIAGIAYVINENLDKLLIGTLMDKYAMGVYSACYKLAIFMNLYIMAFRLGAEPFFFNHANQKEAPKTYANILHYFVIVGSLVLVGIVVFIDLLKQLFINEDYWEAIVIVPVVLLANLFLGVYHNLAVWYKLTDKTRYAMLFSLVGAGITIVTNLILIPKIGYMGAAWATLAAYGTMMVLSYCIGKKHYPVPYTIRKSGKYLLMAVLISYTSFYQFRENYFFSVVLLILFGGAIYWNEKTALNKIMQSKE
jgi:O-antigen/teichoic acid export membrane protein